MIEASSGRPCSRYLAMIMSVLKPLAMKSDLSDIGGKDFMIKSVEYVADQKTLISVETENRKLRIQYSDIEPFWAYAEPDSFEGGRAFVKDDYLIFTMLTAGGQGGVVCVWDCNNDKLVHISDGSYCVAAALADGKLYTLCDISYFGMPYHLRIFSCPFGSMDADTEGTALYADQPVKIENYAETVPSAKLRVANGRIVVVLGEQNILFTADEANAYTMKKEYSAYYNNTAEGISDVDIDDFESDFSLNSGIMMRQGMLL